MVERRRREILFVNPPLVLPDRRLRGGSQINNTYDAIGGYENFERSGRRPDREKLQKRGRGWFGARERVVARSAAGLKSPKMEVFLDFRSQKGPKSDLIYLSMGGYEHGGVRNVHQGRRRRPEKNNSVPSCG